MSTSELHPSNVGDLSDVSNLTPWLEQLANELFSAVPGQSVGVNQLGSLPQGGDRAGFNPAVASATPAITTPPPLSVPEQRLDSPYSSDALNLHAKQSSLHSSGVNPADFGLPDEAQLRQLLAPRLGASPISAAEHGQAAVPSSFGSSFYFLDYAQPAGPAGIQVPGLHADPFQARHGQPQQGLSSIARPPLDPHLLRKDFPILRERVSGGKQLIWLDNAATTQKPQAVIDRISHFYEHENSNIHRAAHELAARSTDAYEGARESVRRFLNAKSTNEIVFVRGTTEAINLVAKSWGEANIGKGDEIIISWLEHHANIVPWQQLVAKTGAVLRVIPVNDNGELLLDEYAKLLSPRTKLVSFTQVSNALGTITPAKRIIELAHQAGAKVLLDGAQSVSHLRADVQALDCDWFVFSGHKVFGPTGIGVLYGKEALLNETPPWQGGGNMIEDVTFENTRFHAAPFRFEAGTGNIADAVGLGAALDYVQRIGIDNIAAYEHQLLVYGTRLLSNIPGLRIIGTAQEKAGVLSFVLDGFETTKVGALLNQEGIAVRSGHHCAQPILRRFGLEATVRPSLAFYNTCSDLDALATALLKIKSSKNAL
ncbi:cysteine desulfurase [Chitinibacter fontanus]|uniref:cysteine desulfurase n=1 Tax=Chitinibacter fontanus TaxID=1737446 RepID=A0A7D5VCP6_9NEIS|nr:family 2A encapsulin nanocompartment cargo protein cysteine desulfurase [Chitinibacter fontanus]QLI83000.1 cysteine desulfurase [Chitinibacter fontanus]